jgi:hypothetical protein
MALNNPFAHYYDGVDDSTTITLQNSFINDPSLTGQMTVEFWAIIQGGYYILSSGSQTSGRKGFHITYQSGLRYVGVRDGSRALEIHGAEMPLNETHHYAMVWDGDTLKWLVDGVVTNETGAIAASSGGVDNNLLIGRPTSVAGFYGKFYMDELRIWDHARTPTQIQDYMYKTLTGTETGLELYLRFDTGSGSIAVDSSPNGYHGAITGATWVPGLVDLDGLAPPGRVDIFATLCGSSSATAKADRVRGLSAHLAGAATSTGGTPIRIRGLSANLQGAGTTNVRMNLIAALKAHLQGQATLKSNMLVLFVPEGVYVIDADEIFSKNQPLSPDSLANYIEVWVNPLKPVAEAQEVYKTDEDDPFPISANETKTVTIHYKKEPVTEVNIEFVNAPPYATIDSIKHYAWGADVTVTSPDAGTFELVATGKPLEVQGRELVIRKNDTSILENGIKKYTFDNPFVQDRATAEMIAEKLLSFAIPQADIEIDWRGDPALALADPVLIPTFQRQGLDQREVFYVTKQELEFDGGLRAKLSGRKMGGGSENG